MTLKLILLIFQIISTVLQHVCSDTVVATLATGYSTVILLAGASASLPSWLVGGALLD